MASAITLEPLLGGLGLRMPILPLSITVSEARNHIFISMRQQYFNLHSQSHRLPSPNRWATARAVMQDSTIYLGFIFASWIRHKRQRYLLLPSYHLWETLSTLTIVVRAKYLSDLCATERQERFTPGSFCWPCHAAPGQAYVSFTYRSPKSPTAALVGEPVGHVTPQVLPTFRLGRPHFFARVSPDIPSGGGRLCRFQLCGTLREGQPLIDRASCTSSRRSTYDEDRNGAEGGPGRRPNQAHDEGGSYVYCATRLDREAFRQRIIWAPYDRNDREARVPPIFVLGKAETAGSAPCRGGKLLTLSRGILYNCNVGVDTLVFAAWPSRDSVVNRVGSKRGTVGQGKKRERLRKRELGSDTLDWGAACWLRLVNRGASCWRRLMNRGASCWLRLVNHGA